MKSIRVYRIMLFVLWCIGVSIFMDAIHLDKKYEYIAVINETVPIYAKCPKFDPYGRANLKKHGVLKKNEQVEYLFPAAIGNCDKIQYNGGEFYLRHGVGYRIVNSGTYNIYFGGIKVGQGREDLSP